MKKLLALLLATVMVLALFACAPAQPPVNSGNNGTNNGTNNGGNGNSGGVQYDVTPITFPLEDQVTLKVAIKIASGTVDDVNAHLQANTLWKELLEKTNVRFEFITYNESNIAAMFQTGRMGDLVMAGGSGGATLFNTFISSGQLLPLEQYVDSEAIMPNLNKYVFGEVPEARAAFTSGDGHIYSLGSLDIDKSPALEYPLWINKKWLDKCGLEVPTTFAELEAALLAFKGDMNGNGRDDEIPCLMSLNENRGVEILLGMWGIPTKDGTYDNYVYIEGDEVVFAPQTDTYKRFIKKMNEWYENGILYRDIFTGDYGTVQSLYMGTVDDDVRVGLIGINNISLVRNAEDYVCLTPPAAEEGVKVRWYLNPCFLGSQNIFCIPKTSSNPKLACAIMDMFYSPDYTIRSKYGETDSIWRQTNSDGTFTPLYPDLDTQEEYKYTSKNKFDDANGYTMQFPSAKTSDFYELYQHSEQDKLIQSAVQQYEAAGVLNTDPWPRPYYTQEGSETVTELRTVIFKLVNEKRAAWITGQADIDEEWDEFQDDLESCEIEEMMEALQEAYDLWKQNRADFSK